MVASLVAVQLAPALPWILLGNCTCICRIQNFVLGCVSQWMSVVSVGVVANVMGICGRGDIVLLDGLTYLVLFVVTKGE